MNQNFDQISSIDTSLLVNRRTRGNKLIAQCPACAANGSDNKGDHFFLNHETGQFGCSAHQGDREHRKEIFARVGLKNAAQPQYRQQRCEAKRKERHDAEAREQLAKAARRYREGIVKRFAWNKLEVLEGSPQRGDIVQSDSRHFLKSLFAPDALVWTGKVYDSGNGHADHWRTVADWQAARACECGPHTTPAIWKPGTVNRTVENVQSSPYTVLDFDGFDGRKPETQVEVVDHIRASLAITRWLREFLDWRLSAILWTGSKSIHAWFHTPPPAVLRSLKDTSAAMGLDSGLIGNAAHPCRLPGWKHEKTNKFSRTLWLQAPLE